MKSPVPMSADFNAYLYFSSEMYYVMGRVELGPVPVISSRINNSIANENLLSKSVITI